MSELTTGKVIALIRALSTSSTSSSTYTVTDALVIGAATTSGVRLDLESGVLAVREGDDSAYAPLTCGNLTINDLVWANAGTLSMSTGGFQIGGVSSPGMMQIRERTRSGATSIGSVLTTSASLTSGASYTFTGALPDGAVILGVSARITTTVTGPTSVQVGDGSDPDRYGTFSTLTAGQTISPADGTADPLEWRSAAGDVVLTAVGGNFTAGVVRLSVHCVTFTAPQS